MERVKEQFLDSKPNLEAVSRLRVLLSEGRYSESGQVLDVLKAVGII